MPLINEAKTGAYARLLGGGGGGGELRGGTEMGGRGGGRCLVSSALSLSLESMMRTMSLRGQPWSCWVVEVLGGAE